MKFTPAASTRTSACPLPGAGVGSSISFITSGPPVDSTRMALMAPSRHVALASSRGSARRRLPGDLALWPGFPQPRPDTRAEPRHSLGDRERRPIREVEAKRLEAGFVGREALQRREVRRRLDDHRDARIDPPSPWRARWSSVEAFRARSYRIGCTWR